ncbi:hypothetical protein LCGC14_1775070 [marine sediment metagenome]|uniref:Uncharacterized protein n=1 Tax=marine sediment metagenome TaxID=412755 RepID=A0A0F9GX87_9ZZZZ
MKEKKVLNVRKYKAGYEIREELIDGSEFGGEDFIMKTAYTTSGDYIGDPKRAYWLCKKCGIAPEKISPDHNVCSIGFCKKDKKWAGWSHRGMFMFGIGSKTKKGDCGFVHGNVLELFASFSDDEKARVVKVDADGITMRHDNVRQVPESPKIGEEVEWVPAEPSYQTIEVGRGEWTAETLDEARLMAIDFAKGVS